MGGGLTEGLGVQDMLFSASSVYGCRLKLQGISRFSLKLFLEASRVGLRPKNFMLLSEPPSRVLANAKDMDAT